MVVAARTIHLFLMKTLIKFLGVFFLSILFLATCEDGEDTDSEDDVGYVCPVDGGVQSNFVMDPTPVNFDVPENERPW